MAESTSKLCWFNLSSFLKSSPSSEEAALTTRVEAENEPSQSAPPSPDRTASRSKKSCISVEDAASTSHLNRCILSKCHCSDSNASALKKRIGKRSKKQKEEESGFEEGGESVLSCPKCSTLSSNTDLYGQGNNGNKTQRLTHGLSLKEAPHYLTFNPYITGGYRNNLRPFDCIRSLFWWTNETLNIWSHLLGWLWFFGLSIHDLMGFSALPKTQPWDQAIFTLLLLCFQACMILSASYHVFCCCSETSYRHWLTMDLLGVSLSLLAIYISGIYYAFSCVPFWLNFYLSTVAAIFLCCLTCTFLRTSDGFSNRLVLFGGWACYGIVPTAHWALLHGANSNAVALLLPRIFWMYAIAAAAFFFYVSKLPERWRPGLVNYVGSSHQIWHVLIVAALYHWHNTGMLYLEYRARHPCAQEYAHAPLYQ